MTTLGLRRAQENIRHDINETKKAKNYLGDPLGFLVILQLEMRYSFSW